MKSSATMLVRRAGVSPASKPGWTAILFSIVAAIGFNSSHALQGKPPEETSAPEKKSPRLDRFGDPLPPGAIRRFGTLRFRHHGIYDLAFTPDSKRLIAGMGMAPLSVFDAGTGRKLRDVGKSTSGSTPGLFAVSPNGKWVAVGGGDLLLWDLETGELVHDLHCPRYDYVAFSPDSKVLAATRWLEQAEVVRFDTATGKPLEKWILKKGKRYQYLFYSLAFSPDGKYLAGIFSELRQEKRFRYETVSSQVWLLDAKNGTQVRTLGSSGTDIRGLAFQPGTGRLVTSEKKGILRFWDVETGKEVQHFSIARDKNDSKGGFSSYILRFSADGRRCAVVDGNAGLLLVVDARTGREVRRIEIAKTMDRVSANLSPDGRTLAAALFLGGPCVRVWDVDSGMERTSGVGHRTPPMLSLSADERTLIGRNEDGQVIHWDIRSSKAVQQRKETPQQEGLRGQPPRARVDWTLRGPRWRLRFHAATSMLAVHRLDDDQLIAETEWHADRYGFALSPGGAYVAAAFLDDPQNTVLLWNPEKEKKPRRLSGHPAFCRNLLFSHGGRRLIAAGGNRDTYRSSTLWVWDVATAQPIHKLATNKSTGRLVLSADDRLLFSGGSVNDPKVHVWDMEKGRELAVLADPLGKEEGAIDDLALSGDERFLAVVLHQGGSTAASIWETGSWKLVKAFAPVQPANYARSMVLSRDGRSLFVSNSDTTILQWDVSGRFGRKDETPNRDRLNVLWQTLAQTPDKAYPAVWEFLDHPTESVPFLIAKVSPVKPVEETRVRRLLAQLDSESFAEREESSRQLAALGEQIVPLLQRMLKGRLPLETRKRVEGVIESLNRLPSSDQLRVLRALAVLEWSNRPEAVEHLRRLADGAASASLTQAAKAAWRRQQK